LAADVVYLDAKTDTYLEEVSSCNIFVRKGKTIKTPPLGGTILPGELLLLPLLLLLPPPVELHMHMHCLWCQHVLTANPYPTAGLPAPEGL
jgi:hypothetical protein